jgi:uncharacterized protein
MFTPLSSLLGGVLIGLAAALLLLVEGRIAGISGIVAGALPPRRGELGWRALFLAGLVGSGALLALVDGAAFPATLQRSPAVLVGAGLLVGFGARLSGGCTSGHGVCGLGRSSSRSLVAVVTFMLVGAAAVFVARVIGGAR